MGRSQARRRLPALAPGRVTASGQVREDGPDLVAADGSWRARVIALEGSSSTYLFLHGGDAPLFFGLPVWTGRRQARSPWTRVLSLQDLLKGIPCLEPECGGARCPALAVARTLDRVGRTDPVDRMQLYINEGSGLVLAESDSGDARISMLLYDKRPPSGMLYDLRWRARTVVDGWEEGTTEGLVVIPPVIGPGDAVGIERRGGTLICSSCGAARGITALDLPGCLHLAVADEVVLRVVGAGERSPDDIRSFPEFVLAELEAGRARASDGSTVVTDAGPVLRITWNGYGSGTHQVRIEWPGHYENEPLLTFQVTPMIEPLRCRDCDDRSSTTPCTEGLILERARDLIARLRSLTGPGDRRLP